MDKDLIEKTMDELSDVEGVIGCILYRVDGVPIITRSDNQKKIMEVLLWLEDNIGSVLDNIKEKRVSSTTFDVQNQKVVVKPVSNSIVLVVVLIAKAHLQLLSIEITRAANLLLKGTE